VNGDWGGEPLHAQNLRYDVKVRSGSPREKIEALLKHTDQQAEVLATLRSGTAVKLNNYELNRFEV
jgi:hypothetical protein